MRQALAQAGHHVAHRRAFQRSLIDAPIMASVIADLVLEVEGRRLARLPHRRRGRSRGG